MIHARSALLVKTIRTVVLFGLITALPLGCGPDKFIPKPTALPPGAYQIDDKVYHPIDIDDAVGFRQQGTASWYGEQFHEKKTANGEVYDMYAMTAAHKTLPFGTMVEVRNLENNKRTVVRINDRGPFVRERIIDLSYTAAREIEMIGNGTASVEIFALGTDDEVIAQTGSDRSANAYFTGDFTIQVGSFTDEIKAERLKLKLEEASNEVYVSPFDKNGTTYYRVRVGRYSSLKQAKAKEIQLIESGFDTVYTVAWDL